MGLSEYADYAPLPQPTLPREATKASLQQTTRVTHRRTGS